MIVIKRKIKTAAAAVLLAGSMLTLGSCGLPGELLNAFVSGLFRDTGRTGAMQAQSFDSITVDIVGDEAATREYEILRTDGGARLSYYIISWGDDGDTPKDEYLNMRREGGEDFYNELLGLVNECHVKEWDGFSGYDPDVLDGSSASISAVIDGGEIHAHGNNSFPEGYSDFVRALREMLKED